MLQGTGRSGSETGLTQPNVEIPIATGGLAVGYSSTKAWRWDFTSKPTSGVLGERSTVVLCVLFIAVYFVLCKEKRLVDPFVFLIRGTSR